MFRRFFWLVVGVGFGFGTAFWMARWARSTVERYSPERLSSDLSGALQRLGQDLRAAGREFREGMHEAETEIRARLEGER